MGRKVKAAVLAAVLGAGVLAAPASASAAQASALSRSCGYPRFCLYVGSQDGYPTARFRDVTSYYQKLSRSKGARGFKNTRHDDVVYVKLQSGRVICVRPGATGGLMPGDGAVAIRISYRSSC
jgi:hypothetical protein